METPHLFKLRVIAAFLLCASVAALPRPASANVSGSIFTTDVNATAVNLNFFSIARPMFT